MEAEVETVIDTIKSLHGFFHEIRTELSALCDRGLQGNDKVAIVSLKERVWSSLCVYVSTCFAKDALPDNVVRFFGFLCAKNDADKFTFGSHHRIIDGPCGEVYVAKLQESMFTMWFDKAARSEKLEDLTRTFSNVIPLKSLQHDEVSKLDENNLYTIQPDGFCGLVKLEVTIARSMVTLDRECTDVESMLLAKALQSKKDLISTRMSSVMRNTHSLRHLWENLEFVAGKVKSTQDLEQSITETIAHMEKFTASVKQCSTLSDDVMHEMQVEMVATAAGLWKEGNALTTVAPGNLAALETCMKNAVSALEGKISDTIKAFETTCGGDKHMNSGQLLIHSALVDFALQVMSNAMMNEASGTFKIAAVLYMSIAKAFVAAEVMIEKSADLPNKCAGTAEAFSQTVRAGSSVRAHLLTTEQLAQISEGLLRDRLAAAGEHLDTLQAKMRTCIIDVAKVRQGILSCEVFDALVVGWHFVVLAPVIVRRSSTAIRACT
jgi:hypothetical protein